MGMQARFLFLILLWTATAAEDELVYVMELAHHGATYPQHDVDWSVVPEDLTPAGATQHYLLGRSMRQRYVEQLGFLKHSYCPEEIAFYSCDDDSCASSATAQAFGIYPPGSTPEFPFDPTKAAKALPPNPYNYEKWSKELLNSPLKYSLKAIPVSTHNIELDVDDEGCSGLYDIVNQTLNATKLSEDLKDSYDELAETFKVTGDMDLEQASLLRETLISGLYAGEYPKNEKNTLELLERTKDVYRAQMHDNFLNVTHEGVKLGAIVSSRFLRRMKDTLKAIAKEKREEKMEVFVGDEVLMQAVLTTLFNTFEDNAIPFASILLLEVYKESEGKDLRVRVVYNKELKYEGDIDDFIDKLSSVIVSESTIGEVCAGDYEAPFYKKYWDSYWDKYGYLLIALGALALGVFIAVMINCCHKKSEEELKLTQQPPV